MDLDWQNDVETGNFISFHIISTELRRTFAPEYNEQIMKLLIIEDEHQLSDSIVSYLNREDYLCEQTFTFGEAMMKVGVYEYDCILLDLMLPGGSGLDILRRIKQRTPQTGVIIVSAKDSLDDKVAGLQIGADDYIAKPFHLPELSMRIFALLRRKNFTATNTLRSGGNRPFGQARDSEQPRARPHEVGIRTAAVPHREPPPRSVEERVGRTPERRHGRHAR